MSWTEQSELATSLLADLKTELTIEDTTDDARLDGYLTDAQAALTTRYGLTTVPAAASTQRYFCDGVLVLFREPYASITAVTDEGTNALGYTALSDGIRLDSPRVGDILITATWGAATRPADEARAIIVTAATYYKRASSGDDGGAYRGGGEPIPAEAKHLMEARRVVRL